MGIVRSTLTPPARSLPQSPYSQQTTAAAFGVEPRVTILSYATGTSNTGPLIQKVIDATEIAKKKRPDLLIEGPLQRCLINAMLAEDFVLQKFEFLNVLRYDAAVNPETAKTKLKGKESSVAGKATVLIFPDLNTGNNTCKAVQQSTRAVAVGPLLQGQ